ncbi:MAG: Asp-tRNA(Asn)/Glu-tRNA(Gln) amidotransferase subunit GatB [Candidatus Eremiobacteraeota bacterium]|nr:Asp-tRNA(Asn)/Glu-tRNA(Gln) amidotransferase subunit GatB [Candidatus Eremiobacteraeota bacterium]
MIPEHEIVEFEPVIGLEVHVELSTASKMFCGCRNEFGAPPNSLVCAVCLGLPGTLPVINRRAVEYLCKTGFALGCAVSARSKFDRKNYFYPDMPKNYQISQYDAPLTTGGAISLRSGKRIRLNRIHLEEDTGKNLHAGTAISRSDYTLIDYNRAGVPLMEIVSEPDISSPHEAEEYLIELKGILSHIGVSDVKMHQGSLRCDANVSVRPAGSAELGVKAEVKNMNSFRSVVKALGFEIERMGRCMAEGRSIVAETRGWDETRAVTHSMRSKEQAHDYRYFPDPDLMPLSIDAADIDRWRAELPELPAAKRARFGADYGLSAYDASVLTEEPADADFFEAAAKASGDAKQTANWLMGDVRRCLQQHELTLSASPMRPAQLAELIAMVKSGAISGKAAKQVCDLVVTGGRHPKELVAELGLRQTSDASEIAAIVDGVVANNAESVAAYRGGKAKALDFLIGQVMRESRGKANVDAVRSRLRNLLD